MLKEIKTERLHSLVEKKLGLNKIGLKFSQKKI